MPSLADLVHNGASSAWLFIPSAILLGALHGLEPGHSKTMMAAFIVAIGGTVRQAVLLGLAATVSHTAIVWIIAVGGMTLFRGMNAHAVEPYFQLGSGLLIVALSLWMLWRNRRESRRAHAHPHEHPHAHPHDHDDHPHAHGHGHSHDHHDDHGRAPGVSAAAVQRTIDLEDGGYQDAHERQHAEDIRQRFAGREVSTAQIVMFGITGGLIPCPGAITVLLLCLQLKKITLGAVVVLCFSIGLAATMVTSGVIAAISVKHVARRFSGFGEIVRKAPYVSGVLILCVGAYVAVQGWMALPHPG